MHDIIATSSGGRWGTESIRVAACLLTYGYQLCRQQPIIRLRDPDGKRQDGVSIWFEPNHPTATHEVEALRVPESCQHWESHWIKPAKWQTLVEWQPRPHPWVYMRAGLEALQYIEERGNQKLPRDREIFQTDNKMLAACLVSLRFRMFDREGQVCTFPAAARKLEKPFLDDRTNHVIRWPKFAIAHYDRLCNALRYPAKGDVANFGFRVGDRIALIPEDAPPSVREPLMRMLQG